MAKKIEKEVETVETKAEGVVKSASVPRILPITETFGNGDLNTLRDKINELISNQ